MYNFIGRLYKPENIKESELGIVTTLKVRYKSYFGGKNYLFLHLIPKKNILELKVELKDTDIPVYIEKSENQIVSNITSNEVLLIGNEKENEYYSKIFKSMKVKFKTDTCILIGLTIEKLNLDFKTSKNSFFKDKTFLEIKYELDVDSEKDYFVITVNEKDNLRVISNSKIDILDKLD